MNDAVPTTIAVPQPGDQRLISFIGKAAALKSSAGGYVIDSPEMYELGTEELRDIKRTFDDVEKTRRSLVDPMNLAVKNTNALFKPITDALDLAKRDLTGKMLAFEDAQRAKQRAAEEAARIEREKAERAAAEKLAAAVAAEDSAAAEAAILEGQMASIGSAVAETGQVDRGGHARRDSYEVVVGDDVPALLRWMADQMEQHQRFGNTVTFKVKELNAFATDTQGRVPIPGAIVRKKSTLAVRK